MADKRISPHTTNASWYFLGMIGSLVYFLQHAHSFWTVILAILESFVWPAFLTYDVFKFIHG